MVNFHLNIFFYEGGKYHKISIMTSQNLDYTKASSSVKYKLVSNILFSDYFNSYKRSKKQSQNKKSNPYFMHTYLMFSDL